MGDVTKAKQRALQPKDAAGPGFGSWNPSLAACNTATVTTVATVMSQVIHYLALVQAAWVSWPKVHSTSVTGAFVSVEFHVDVAFALSCFDSF